MEVASLSLIQELALMAFQELKPGSDAPSNMWDVCEDGATATHLVLIGGIRYRLVRFDSLGWGFSLGLLGAQYDLSCQRRQRSSSLRSVLEQERNRGRFYVLLLRAAEKSKTFPLATLLEDQRGNWHLVEVPDETEDSAWALFTVAVNLLATSKNDPARFDDHGDCLTLGAPCVVQRHSTERLQKHIAQKVIYDRRLCNHCLRCATVCNEMRALVTGRGSMLLGPSEDFCTNCGLCQKRCPFLVATPKENIDRSSKRGLNINERGVGIYLHGDLASTYLEALARIPEAKSIRFPYEVDTLLNNSPEALPIQNQILLSRAPSLGFLAPEPLVLTTMRNESGDAMAVIRSRQRAALVLQTEEGEVEKDIAFAAMRLGIQVRPVVDADQGKISVPNNDTTRLFYQMGQPAIAGKSLSALWKDGEVDLIVAPFADQVSPEMHRLIVEETGRLAHILSPHITQVLPFTKSPLIGQLTSELTAIFTKHPQLIEAEAEYARRLLSDIPRNSAFLHARYRPMAFASGHSACPTCAEAQVLAIPVYMAMAMSLARREIPHVSFTCETGCMSETLNKVGEVAQKVPGGRTVFGGGFAYGEAITMAQDRAVRMGLLKKGRRYVVSQGGDGGAVIGLPAWLNALRQQAFLIRQRQANVLHFINITDTQVYSNTGGESSATSLLGMGTLTTPIGKFLLGNQKIQWTLINLAAEFPGILVGAGHSANKIAMQQFWHLADQLGQSAIRWDITPCPETGKFFGEDPDDLAEVMAHAGMVPEIIFVGRFRKRIAPLHPEDRTKPFHEWRSQPKPIVYWLHRDPRYRSLFQKSPQTGQYEPRNLTAHFLITQLESYRDQLNWQIDLETHLVRRAEEWVAAFFSELKESWKHYRYRLEQFPYAMLFNRHGELKPDYSANLEMEMVLRILGWDEMMRYLSSRDQVLESQQDQFAKVFAELDKLERIAVPQLMESEKPSVNGKEVDEIISRIQAMEQTLKQEANKLREILQSTSMPDPLEMEIFSSESDDSRSLPEMRRKALSQLLERIIEERGLARQMDLQQYRLAQLLKQDFLKGGGLIREHHAVTSQAQRQELFRQILRTGPFSIGVASLAGDRGIAINRIFATFFTAKGAWAGMAWQFGSSKRGTPVLSATFVDAKPLDRKDAMHSFPMAVLTVTNYEEMKRQPDLFFSHLHPGGFLIINHQKHPEALWQELVGFYPQEIQETAFQLREDQTVKEVLRSTAPDMESILDKIAEILWQKRYSLLTGEQRHWVKKTGAMVSVRVISVDMDGIMKEVTGSSKVVSNLVAIAPMFQALQELGFPFDWGQDLKILTQEFPAAVLKNKTLLNHYFEAMERARLQSGIDVRTPGDTVEDARGESREDSISLSCSLSKDDPGEYMMIMGGTLAGMVLSQVALPEHPLFYIGFPITPAGNPFYAMAEAYANGHPYIVVDEVNPSEKVAAEKLLGVARTGGFLPVTFTASQGWRLFTEIIPQFVGARLEGLFLIAKRALAAPNLNIEESHTDFMSFRDDGGIMLAPKSVQEYVPSLYLARLLTHFAKMPVVLSIGGITDTHKIGLVKVPSDEKVRYWLKKILRDFDFLEHKLMNRQGDLIVHGPSGTSAVYQETQSEIEKAHQAAARVYPYAVKAVHELTGVTLDEIEVSLHSEPEKVETLFILQGSLYPNAVEALQELQEEGWEGMACMSIRCFNPFPEEKLFGWLTHAERIVVLDRSNSFGSIPPLASRIFNTLARFASLNASPNRKQLRTMVGGLGGREITVKEMREIFVSTHLLFNRSKEWETPLIETWIEKDETLGAFLQEAAALDLRNTNRHTRVPLHVRSAEAQQQEYENHLGRIKKLLARKDYSSFLANYHQVEFIGPREVLQETTLLQQIVLRLEILLSRHAISSGLGTWRHPLILLHYSFDTRDHETAAAFLLEKASEMPLLARLAERYGVRNVHLPEPHVDDRKQRLHLLLSESQEEDKAQSAEAPSLEPGAQLPTVVFDPEEAERIRTILTAMVTLQSEEPLFYNSEDYAIELIEQLQSNPQSPLFQLRIRRSADEVDHLIQQYQQCYRDVIDSTLHREILTQHHAPELKELFHGEGLKRIQELIKELEKHLAEEPAENKKKEMIREIELYLLERCFPYYPRSALFYMEYFRNWIAPELFEGFKQRSHSA